MYFPILTILPILSFISFTSAFATDNTTADIDPRTFRNNWGKQKCALVKGRIGIYKFDFGCLCSGTVDSYAKNNKFDNNLKNLVSDIINKGRDEHSYPPNAQPMCHDNGDYTCGSLQKDSRTGLCAPSGCPNHLVSINGGCCAPGQDYRNGRCCGKVGCKLSGDQCEPELTCDGHKSNGVCCDKAHPDWVGQKTVCCPPTQVEGEDGNCGCPHGTTLHGKKCEATCESPLKFKTTICCPENANEVGGKCDCGEQKKLEGEGKWAKCVKKCTIPGQTFSVHEDQCLCPEGQQIVGAHTKWAKCGDICKMSETYNKVTKHCDPKCDASTGHYYQPGWKHKGLCCRKTQTACNTVCCPTGKEEVGESGVCCPKGSTLDDHHQCVSPTNYQHQPHRRQNGAQLNLHPSVPHIFGMENNKNGELCPGRLAACPIEGGKGAYECLNALEDLQSCGGCASMGTGVDCTLIDGAQFMGCNTGKCEVYSCKSGYVKNADSTKCIAK